LRKLGVAELLLGTVASLLQLGYAKLGEKNTGEARLAIEAVRALVPVLEGSAPTDRLRDLRQATANLQLAYADAVAREPRPQPAPAERAPAEGTAAEGAPATADEAPGRESGAEAAPEEP